jgi:hypothetical protein
MKTCLIAVVLLLSVTALQAQSADSNPPGQNQASEGRSEPVVSNVVVSSSRGWTDSKLDLQNGDVVQIEAARGQVGCGPDTHKTTSAIFRLDVSTAPQGTLIAKIDHGTPFLIGANKALTINQTGRLFLGMNAGDRSPCTAVKLQLTSAPVAAQIKSKLKRAAQTWLARQFGTGTPEVSPSPGISGSAPAVSVPATPTHASELKLASSLIDPDLAKDLNAIPRRVNDQFNNLGDMVNFVIVGSQQKLQAAFGAAHWQLADESTQVALVSAILETYENKDYLRMPMSTLYLFNRPQDFGYEQAEAYPLLPAVIIAEFGRHHSPGTAQQFGLGLQPTTSGLKRTSATAR